MTTQAELYRPGDWIVHRRHGVGQIQALEVKQISGEETAYYKLKTQNSLVWIPIDKSNGRRCRPLSSPIEFRQALDVLQRPPRRMEPNFNKRKSRIQEVYSANSPLAIARLLRDLWGRQTRRKSLSNTEQDALRRFTDRFLAEWSACMNVEMDEARQKLYDMLRQSQQRQLTAMAQS